MTAGDTSIPPSAMSLVEALRSVDRGVPQAVAVKAVGGHEYGQEMRIQFRSRGGGETAGACSEFSFLMDLSVGSEVVLRHEGGEQVIADLLVI